MDDTARGPGAWMGQGTGGHQLPDRAVRLHQVVLGDPLYVFGGDLVYSVEILVDQLVVSEHLVLPEQHRFAEYRILPIDELCLLLILRLLEFVSGYGLA